MSRSEKLYFVYLMYTHEHQFKKINITCRLRKRSAGARAPRLLEQGWACTAANSVSQTPRATGPVVNEEKKLQWFGQMSLESLAQPSFKSPIQILSIHYLYFDYITSSS